MDVPNGNCDVLSPAGLNRVCMLPRGHRSLNHIDQHGYVWSDAGQVSGDRPRRIMEERLRNLLAYLEGKGDHEADSVGYYERMYECPAYAEAALHLKNILDVS